MNILCNTICVDSKPEVALANIPKIASSEGRGPNKNHVIEAVAEPKVVNGREWLLCEEGKRCKYFQGKQKNAIPLV